MEKYQSFIGLVTVALLLCVYTVNNKIIVALTGSALVALLFWSFVKIRSSKNVDSKTKRSVWWVVLILVSVITVMFFKLTRLLDR
jgi:heme A synthase